MKRSRRNLFVISLFVLAVLVAACGGSSGTPVPEAPKDPVDPSDHEAPNWATGVITAEIDGKSVGVYTLLVDDRAGGHDSTATWQDMRTVNHVDVDLNGHPTRNALDYNGAITIEVALDAQLNQEPVIDEGNKPFKVTYWESIEKGYVMQDGSVEVDEAVLLDEDTLHIKGTFAGTFESQSPYAEGSKQVTNGTFDVWKVIREEL